MYGKIKAFALFHIKIGDFVSHLTPPMRGFENALDRRYEAEFGKAR
jgi:hypothetical protein